MSARTYSVDLGDLDAIKHGLGTATVRHGLGATDVTVAFFDPGGRQTWINFVPVTPDEIILATGSMSLASMRGYRVTVIAPALDRDESDEMLAAEAERLDDMVGSDTTWRYAATVERTKDGPIFAVREVYETPGGKLSWTANPIAAQGETWQELVDDLLRMSRDAADERVLDITDEGNPVWVPRFVPLTKETP